MIKAIFKQSGHNYKPLIVIVKYIHQNVIWTLSRLSLPIVLISLVLSEIALSSRITIVNSKSGSGNNLNLLRKLIPSGFFFQFTRQLLTGWSLLLAAPLPLLCLLLVEEGQLGWPYRARVWPPKQSLIWISWNEIFVIKVGGLKREDLLISISRYQGIYRDTLHWLRLNATMKKN